MAQTLAQRVSQHDREIGAIRKLLLAGMKMLNRVDQQLDRLAGEQEAMRKDLRELAAIQRQTAAEGRETRRDLQRLIRSLARGGNGRDPSSN